MIEGQSHPEQGLTIRAQVTQDLESIARGSRGLFNRDRLLAPDAQPTSWSLPTWDKLETDPSYGVHPVLWASIDTTAAQHISLRLKGSSGYKNTFSVLKNGEPSTLQVDQDILFPTADLYVPGGGYDQNERLTNNGLDAYDDRTRTIIAIETPESTKLGHVYLPKTMPWQSLIDSDSREFGLAPQEKDFFRRQQVALGLLEAGTDPLVDSGVGVVKSDSLKKELLTEVSRGKISVSIDLARSVKASLDAIEPADYKALESLIANTAIGPQRLKLEMLLAEGNVTASLAVQHFDGKKARWRNDKTQDMNPEFVAAIMDQLTEKVPDPEPILDEQPTTGYWISVNEYSGYPGDGAGRELDWSVKRKPEYEQPTTTSAIMAQKMETRAKGGQKFTSAVARKQARNGQKKKTGKSKKS